MKIFISLRVYMSEDKIQILGFIIAAGIKRRRTHTKNNI
jgi:hypothetical protein